VCPQSLKHGQGFGNRERCLDSAVRSSDAFGRLGIQ